MNKKIGLYLHFPFCKAKCRYCDFYSLSCLSHIPDYERALCNAILCFQKTLSPYTVDTVYFGGGTPSLMTERGLVSVFDALRRAFSLSSEPEITMEMNPESASFSLLQTAREMGVNRISFGMQSAEDEELSAIGRLHCAADTHKAVEMAHRAGFDNISLDLMYGLPGQTLASFEKSLQTCVSLSPRHISFYCLTLSPQVPLYEKRDSLPDEEETREMYLCAHSFLEREGFEHYEISNAARPGFRSRHNEGYWLGKEYLGIGPGAHSFLNEWRFQMEADTEKFILASNPSDRIICREKVEGEDARLEYIMLSLRRREGIDLKHLLSLSDEEFCKRAEKKLSLWCRHGLCRATPTGFALTPEGCFVSNEIISELI